MHFPSYTMLALGMLLLPISTVGQDCNLCLSRRGFRLLNLSIAPKQACLPGMQPVYNDVNGTYECEDCPPNTFKSDFGPEACTPCPLGTFTGDELDYGMVSRKSRRQAQVPTPTGERVPREGCLHCQNAAIAQIRELGFQVTELSQEVENSKSVLQEEREQNDLGRDGEGATHTLYNLEELLQCTRTQPDLLSSCPSATLDLDRWPSCDKGCGIQCLQDLIVEKKQDVYNGRRKKHNISNALANYLVATAEDTENVGATAVPLLEDWIGDDELIEFVDDVAGDLKDSSGGMLVATAMLAYATNNYSMPADIGASKSPLTVILQDRDAGANLIQHLIDFLSQLEPVGSGHPSLQALIFYVHPGTLECAEVIPNRDEIDESHPLLSDVNVSDVLGWLKPHCPYGYPKGSQRCYKVDCLEDLETCFDPFTRFQVCSAAYAEYLTDYRLYYNISTPEGQAGGIDDDATAQQDATYTAYETGELPFEDLVTYQDYVTSVLAEDTENYEVEDVTKDDETRRYRRSDNKETRQRQARQVDPGYPTKITYGSLPVNPVVYSELPPRPAVVDSVTYSKLPPTSNYVDLPFGPQLEFRTYLHEADRARGIRGRWRVLKQKAAGSIRFWYDQDGDAPNRVSRQLAYGKMMNGAIGLQAVLSMVLIIDSFVQGLQSGDLDAEAVIVPVFSTGALAFTQLRGLEVVQKFNRLYKEVADSGIDAVSRSQGLSKYSPMRISLRFRDWLAQKGHNVRLFMAKHLTSNRMHSKYISRALNGVSKFVRNSRPVNWLVGGGKHNAGVATRLFGKLAKQAASAALSAVLNWVAFGLTIDQFMNLDARTTTEFEETAVATTAGLYGAASIASTIAAGAKIITALSSAGSIAIAKSTAAAAAAGGPVGMAIGAVFALSAVLVTVIVTFFSPNECESRRELLNFDAWKGNEDSAMEEAIFLLGGNLNEPSCNVLHDVLERDARGDLSLDEDVISSSAIAFASLVANLISGSNTNTAEETATINLLSCVASYVPEGLNASTEFPDCHNRIMLRDIVYRANAIDLDAALDGSSNTQLISLMDTCGLTNPNGCFTDDDCTRLFITQGGIVNGAATCDHLVSLPLATRAQLCRNLLDGSVGDEDENALVYLFRCAEPYERCCDSDAGDAPECTVSGSKEAPFCNGEAEKLQLHLGCTWSELDQSIQGEEWGEIRPYLAKPHSLFTESEATTWIDCTGCDNMTITLNPPADRCTHIKTQATNGNFDGLADICATIINEDEDEFSALGFLSVMRMLACLNLDEREALLTVQRDGEYVCGYLRLLRASSGNIGWSDAKAMLQYELSTSDWNLSNENLPMEAIGPEEALVFVGTYVEQRCNAGILYPYPYGGVSHGFVLAALIYGYDQIDSTTYKAKIEDLLRCTADEAANEIDPTGNVFASLISLPGCSLEELVEKVGLSLYVPPLSQMQQFIQGSQVYEDNIANWILYDEPFCDGNWEEDPSSQCCRYAQYWTALERARVCNALIDGTTGNIDEQTIIRLFQCIPQENEAQKEDVLNLLYQSGCTLDELDSDVDGEEWTFLLKLIFSSVWSILSDSDTSLLINDDNRALVLVRDILTPGSNCPLEIDDIGQNQLDDHSCCDSIRTLSIEQRGVICDQILDDSVGTEMEQALIRLMECSSGEDVPLIMQQPGCTYLDMYAHVDGDEWTRLDSYLVQYVPKESPGEFCGAAGLEGAFDGRCANGNCGQWQNNDYRCCRFADSGTLHSDLTFYCDDLQDGQGCYHDFQCLSGWCYQDHCRELSKEGEFCDDGENSNCDDSTVAGDLSCAQYGYDEYKCCKAGTIIGTITDGDFCGNLPDDANCYVDSGDLIFANTKGQCQSGFCLGGVCKEGEASVGESCGTGGSDGGCQGDSVCGQHGENDYRCCESGQWEIYFLNGEFRDWCTNLDDGEACYFDEQCKNEVCNNNKVCSGKLENWERCSSSAQCTSDLCQTWVENDYCCTTEVFVVGNGYYCSVGAGEPCKFDAQCSATGEVCYSGTCRAPGQEGEGCDNGDDDTCDGSLYCAQKADDDYYCCSNAENCYATEECCTNLGNGQACQYNGQCSSDRCVGGVCSAKLGEDSTCTSDSECISNNCARKGGGLVCCPNGSILRAAQWYCNGLSNGQGCSYDDQCSSGWCHDTQRVCRATNYKASCSTNTDCYSGRCYYTLRDSRKRCCGYSTASWCICNFWDSGCDTGEYYCNRDYDASLSDISC